MHARMGEITGLYSRGDTESARLVAGYVGGERRKDRGRSWIDELGRAEVDTEWTDWSVLADVRLVRESHEQRKKMEISSASRLSCVVRC